MNTVTLSLLHITLIVDFVFITGSILNERRVFESIKMTLIYLQMIGYIFFLGNGNSKIRST